METLPPDSESSDSDEATTAHRAVLEERRLASAAELPAAAEMEAEVAPSTGERLKTATLTAIQLMLDEAVSAHDGRAPNRGDDRADPAAALGPCYCGVAPTSCI